MCLVENKGKTWLVGASRFQLYYSGITVLLGDRFNPSNVHRIRIGDILKLGSVSMLVTRLDAGGGGSGEGEHGPQHAIMDIQHLRQELEPRK